MKENNSMKNSIEEDIKILEEKMNKELDFLIETANKTEQLTAISIIAMKEPIILLFLSILLDYKRVLKENEELKNAVNVVNKEKADWIRTYQEEKDKQIELLIRELYKRTHISTKCYLQNSVEECMQYKNCYECIRKYFENKVKEK